MSADAATAMVEIGMPRLSDSMEEATVLQWLKQPGDVVRKGEPIVEVETDKATIVYEAELDGVLEEIVVDEGETAALGAVIARVRVEGAGPAAAQAPRRPACAGPARGAQPAPAQPASPAATPAPAARRRHMPVATVRHPSRAGLRRSSVSRSRASPAPVREAGSFAPTSGWLPETAAPRLRGSQAGAGPWRRSAHVDPAHDRPAHVAVPDRDPGVHARGGDRHGVRGTDARRSSRVGPGAAPVVQRSRRAGCRARTPRVPGLNASYADGKVRRYGRVNVGVAVATDDALFVPTILDADEKSVFELAAESRRLAEKVRGRSIALDDLADGTFTVSNLGMFGVRRFTAVINHPQAAILAVGEVALRPAAGPDGSLVARRLMDVALSCDHRAVYGADAARFLQRLRNLLEHPVLLVIDRKD